jgi:hypothetical protein
VVTFGKKERRSSYKNKIGVSSLESKEQKEEKKEKVILNWLKVLK